MMKYVFYTVFLMFVSCVSTKSNIKNINPEAPEPVLKNNRFVLTSYAKDPKYGFDEAYPVNVFYMSAKNDTLNAVRYLESLAGPNGETIAYKKIESCCPFETKNHSIGGGFLDVYEITYTGIKKPLKLYINLYEKGELLIPIGFTAK